MAQRDIDHPAGAGTGAPPALRRQLSLLQVSLIGVGIILGAGIYVLIGEASAESGGVVWASFLIAGLATAFTGLSYAELSSMYPRAGASFEYARRGFNIHIAFVTGWLTVTAEIVAAAAVALGFGGYMHNLVGLDDGVAALILLGAGTLVAASGALGSVALAGLLTLVEVGGLVLVSVIGFSDFDGSRVLEGGDAGAVLSGAALVFFAFIGFEDLATFGEEARDPHRTIPRAILISIVVATGLYVLVAVAAVGAVGATVLAGSDAPLAAVAASVLGDSAGDVLGVIALGATANTALLLLMASCRRIYGMAEAGAFPRRLAAISGDTHVPVAGLLLAAGLAALVTLWGDVGAVADVTNFALFVAFATVNAALIALRVRAPDVARPFRSPFRLHVGPWPWLPILPLAGIISSVVLMASLDAQALIGGTVLLGAGVLLAWVWRDAHRRAAAGPAAGRDIA